MKKIFLFCVMSLCVAVCSAQNALELAKQQAELNEFNKKVLNAKPSKGAKKEAKRREKEGWRVPAGSKSIEQQWAASELYGQELMVNDAGVNMKRFIMHTAKQTSGTYNAGYAAARTAALAEIQAMIRSELLATAQQDLNNTQMSAEKLMSVETFEQEVDVIVDGTLTNAIPVITIYRQLVNGQYEVEVGIAVDKKVVMNNIERNAQREFKGSDSKLRQIIEKSVSNIQ